MPKEIILTFLIIASILGVVDKYISSPYEYRSGKTTNIAAAEMAIVFQADSIGYVKLHPNLETFYTLEKGSHTCFDLSFNEIQSYKNR